MTSVAIFVIGDLAEVTVHGQRGIEPLLPGLLSIDVLVLDVAAGVHVDGGLVDSSEGALDFARRAHDEAARGDDRALRNQGAGGYDTAFSDDHAVQNSGTHADEAARLDSAAVQGDRV